MHINATRTTERPGGMTLPEAVLVIFVLIGIIGTTFLGTRAWKKSSDRTACIANITMVQHAVRAFQNQHHLPQGASINIPGEFTGPGNFLPTLPKCPAGGSYSFANTIPNAGSLAATCSLSNLREHLPPSHAEW